MNSIDAPLDRGADVSAAGAEGSHARANGLAAASHRPVLVTLQADDVIHSFAVPAFWIKQDANPGQLHETWVKVDRPGVYFGQCSELCGARHGFMPIAVEVVPQAQFAQWVAQKCGHLPGAKPAAPSPAALPAGTAPAVQQPATAQN